MRRSLTLVCVWLAACGSDSGGTPDPDADVTPLCQPVDAHPISEDAVGAGGPTLIATAGGYALLWADQRDNIDDQRSDDELYFAQLDADGERVGAEVRVTEADGNTAGAALIADGDGFGVAFNDTRPDFALMFTRLDGDGAKQFDEVVVNPLGYPPAITFRDGEYGLVSGVMDVDFVRLADDGTPLGGGLETIADGQNPSMTATSDGWAMVFHRDDVVYFTFLDDAGAAVGSATPISQDAGWRGWLAADASGYAAAWSTHDPAADVRLALIDADGSPRGEEIEVTSGADVEGLPVVASGPGGWGLAWHAGSSQLVFATVTADGDLGPLTVVSTSAGAGFRPLSLVGTDAGYALAWADDRGGDAAPYFARLCP